MEAFIWEVQRRANIFPGSVPHATAQDTEIEGYFVPKDTIVISFLQDVMHSPKDFPDPLKFNIDRFLDANGKFVANPKVCVIVSDCNPYQLLLITITGDPIWNWEEEMLGRNAGQNVSL